MGQELDDVEFWLPSEFLTDDDLLTDFKTPPLLVFPNGIWGNFLGGLSAPVESVIGGSAETESDEDDFVPGLSRRPGYRSYSPSSDYTATKGTEWKMYGSPQSTLPLNSDLPYAAAEEILRIKMLEPSQPPPQPLFGKSCAVTSPFCPQLPQNDTPLCLAYLQLQRMKQQQMMRRRVLRHPPSPATYHFRSLHQSSHPLRPVSATKAPLLPDNTTKKGRNGTGVFLPRLLSTSATDTLKKQVPRRDKEGTARRGFVATNSETIRLPKEWIY